MGDQSEGVFEYLCDLAGVKYVRYGLNRPPISLRNVSAFVRFTPDYLLGDKLVEVQGFGRDQKFKLKVDKLQALHAWSLHHPVWLWAWDSKNKRAFGAPIMDIALEANAGAFPQGFFDANTNNPKAYWEIPATWFVQNGYQL
jgi:hypothetical protein